MLFWDSKATGNPVLILNFLHWQYHVSLMTFDRCKPGSTKVPFLYIYLAFPGSSHGKESIYNAGDTEDVGWDDPLEKEMASHSGILAWKIP